MTAQQEPEHCDHECVCCDFPDDIVARQRCPREGCPYDTRFRDLIQAVDLSHIKPDRRGCLTCLNPDCPIWQAADQNCWESQKEHDAAIAAAAHKKVLDMLEEWDYLNNRNFLKPHPVFADMIRLVREKPEEIREHLKTLRSEVKKR